MEYSSIILSLTWMLLVLFDQTSSKSACKVAMWQPTSELQRLSIAPVVVLGHTVDYVSGDGISFHAQFSVSCVFKSDDIAVKENITIENIFPRNMCSGSKNSLQKNKLSVIGLQRLGSGNYDFYEKNPLETMAIDGDYTFIHNISTTCGLQNWTVPDGSNNSECPICAYEFGIIGNETCMMDNLVQNMCEEVPEFEIFSVCDCSEQNKNPTVVGNRGNTVHIGVHMILLFMCISYL